MERVCKACTTRYAMDRDRCPHCGGTVSWDSFEYEELIMGKITKHGGLTDQATGAGFSEDPDDERAAGTRVAENTGEPAQTDPVDGEALPPAEVGEDGVASEEETSEPGPYAGWTKADLIADAETRTPPVSTAGTKADIVERLLADDKAREQEPGA